MRSYHSLAKASQTPVKKRGKQRKREPVKWKHATTPQWDAKYYSGTETENNDSSQSDSESCTSTSSGTDSDLGQDNVISRDDHSPKHRNIIHDTGD